MQAVAVKEREHLTQTEAAERGLPYLNLQGFPISQEALRLIPEEDVRKLQIAPILRTEQEVRIGVAQPDDSAVRDYLRELAERVPAHYMLYLVSPHSIECALKFYAGLAKVRPMAGGVAITESDLERYHGLAKDFSAIEATLARANITDIVTAIVAGALDLSASDIHVEAEEQSVVIRYRLDGVLYAVAHLNHEQWPQLISRLKLLAHLKLNISGQPQDGRFTIFLAHDKVDVRVSTIPTAYGESVVMRLLRSSATGLKFDDLGLKGKAYEYLKHEITRPNGMILTTGPTGSGKTTTLYAILNQLNDSETKIITLEDPIEYKLVGVNQSQVEHAAGYDFARGLKAILRQDPDVVMVGEIRDFETADTAVNAALTGHLVVSTIHTNSAAGAIPRFLAMGVKPFLLAPALNAVIGQRLVRRICTTCKEEFKPETETMERVILALKNISPKSGVHVDLSKLTFYHGRGCQACSNLGYKGRIGIYEIMTMNTEIEKIVFSNSATEAELQEIAVRNGMVTMVQDGLLKALDGVTSVEEVFKVAE